MEKLFEPGTVSGASASVAMTAWLHPAVWQRTVGGGVPLPADEPALISCKRAVLPFRPRDPSCRQRTVRKKLAATRMLAFTGQRSCNSAIVWQCQGDARNRVLHCFCREAQGCGMETLSDKANSVSELSQRSRISCWAGRCHDHIRAHLYASVAGMFPLARFPYWCHPVRG